MRSARPSRVLLAGTGLVALACTSERTPNLHHTAVAEASLRVRYGDIEHSEVRGRLLSGTRVEALGADRLTRLELVVWDDADGDGLRDPSEARGTPSTFEAKGVSTSFFEWNGPLLPPGNDLRASLTARFVQGDPVTLTWELFPDENAAE